MSDDGGDCGGGDSGGGDTGVGDSGCSGGGDYGGNDDVCVSSNDVGTSHDNSSHSHAGDDHSSHGNTQDNHSSTSQCLPTDENTVETANHTSHFDRHPADDQGSTHCTIENNEDDPNYDYDNQVNLFNSDNTSIDIYDQQDDYISPTRYVGRRYQSRPSGYKQMGTSSGNISTKLAVAFWSIIIGLVVLVLIFKM